MNRSDLSSACIGPFIELNDLKRIYSAGRAGSIATRLFRSAWAALLDGRDVETVALCTTGKALAAARLGDLDRSALISAGVAPRDATDIERRAIDAVAGPLFGLIAIPDTSDVPENSGSEEELAFVTALTLQPRAGITCPGKPRVVLEPPENHAEHCLMVAVYGTLISKTYGADSATVFLASLSHHLHNAGMPDSGFTGEMLLGSSLQGVMDHHTAESLRQLPDPLRVKVETAREILADAETLEGQAFHAADVIDRVLQLNQYMRAAALTPQRMLGDMELVHAGPVKDFHDDVLRRVGLL